MSHIHNPTISVIIPAYNAERWIGETLRSIQNQTINNLEIIVVDDGSTDKTFYIVEKFLFSDSRIKLLTQTNQGVGAARNLGLDASSGEFIAPVDADDIWHPKKLELQLDQMRNSRNDVGLIYSHFSKIDETGEKIGFSEASGIVGNVLFSIILSNFIGNGSVPLIRASALREVGPYLTRIEQNGGEGCEDWEMYIRISEKFTFGLVSQYLVSYRQIINSMSNSTTSMIKSYSTLINLLRIRNPQLPDCIYCKSEHTFYLYLITKSFIHFNYSSCLTIILKRAIRSPKILFDRRVALMFVKSAIIKLIQYGNLKNKVIRFKKSNNYIFPYENKLN